jgi:hypothetical protein
VAAAGDALIGKLVNRHIETVCGSFLDDIANTVKSIASPITDTVASTLKQFKGPISAAATAAAAGGAALIPGVGPLAAPLAGKLAGDLVNSTLGDAKAQQTVAQATQQAQTDPTVAAALDQAKKAVAHSTVAHHVHHMGHRARHGHRGAQQQINQVVADAQQGDPVAKAAMQLVSNLSQGQTGAPGWVSGWYDVVGSAVDDIRERARGHATIKPGNAAGVIQMVDRSFHSRGFPSLDDAIDWLQRSTQRRDDFLYAAAYEKDRAGNAFIQAEEFGSGARPVAAQIRGCGAYVG